MKDTKVIKNVNKIDIIETDLSVTENSKYTTVNGVKEFECGNGYVDNIVIEGKTLVNLHPSSKSFTMYSDTTIYCPLVAGELRLEKNKEYTCRLFNLPSGFDGRVSIKNVTTVENRGSIFKFTTLDTLDSSLPFQIHVYGTGFTSESAQNIKALILEGDYTQCPPSHFEGLKSIGQGDKIEVLSYQGENLFDGTYDNGYFNSTTGGYNETLVTDTPSKTTKWIACKPNTTYYLIGGNRGSVQIKNNNQIIEFRGNYEKQINTPSQCTHFRVYYEKIGEFAPPFKIIEGKQDKKQILTTARSVSDSIKDKIYNQGNKYYKIKRCEETIFNGGESGWILVGSTTSHIGFKIPTSSAIYDRLKVVSDKFVTKFSSTDECIFLEGNSTADRSIIIFITKAKLTTTQDLAGFKSWLASNPVTVVYELATPIIEELPNFNPRTFDNKSTILLNSGIVQGEASFEVTNSTRSELEVLKGKVSDLDDSYVEYFDITPLNGWTIQNKDFHECKLNNGIVTINTIIVGGTNVSGTKLFQIPKKYCPNKNKIFQTTSTNDKTITNIVVSTEGYVTLNGTITNPAGWNTINLSYSIL